MSFTYRLCFLLFLLPAISNAQKISGTIRDSQGKAVAEAAVSLSKVSDSALLKTVLSDGTGHFELNAEAGSYLIEVTASGQQPVREEIVLAIDESKQKDFSLSANSSNLNNVTVTASKPFIEAKAGMMVVNIENSVSSAGSNALELLQRAPGVRVDAQGAVSMRGKDGVDVYVDGRPTRLAGDQLLALLKSMTSEEISKIELITQPPAKYEAVGSAGIINIRTRLIRKKGFNGQLSGSLTKATWWSGNLSGRISYNRNKLKLYVSEYFNYVDNKNELSVTRHFFDPSSGKETAVMQTDQDLRYDSRFHRIKAGGEYAIDQKTTVGLRAQLPIGTPSMSFQNYSSLTQIPDESVRYTSGERNMENRWWEREFGLLGRHSFSDDEQISVDAFIVDNQGGDKGYFVNQEWEQDSTQLPTDIWHLAFPVKMRLISAQTDYNRKLGSDIKMESGIKVRNANSDFRSEFQIPDANGVMQPDTLRSNQYLYQETVTGAYVSLSRSFGSKWETQAGLRAEHTRASGEVPKTKQSFDRNYVSLFPTVYASYKPDSVWTLTGSYGRRIDRPNYYMLNPARNYIDKYTYSIGNPFLQPQFINNVEVAIAWKSILTATFSYMKTNGVITDFFVQDNQNQTAFEMHDNIPGYYQTGTSLNYNQQVTKFWTVNLYADLFYRQYTGSYFGQPFDERGHSFSSNMNNQFRLKRGWAAELSGWYNGPGMTTLFTIPKAMGSLDFGISKKLCSDSLTIKLAVNDILGTQKYRANSQFNQMNTDVMSTWDARRAVFSLNYQFGKNFEMMQRRSDAEQRSM